MLLLQSDTDALIGISAISCFLGYIFSLIYLSRASRQKAGTVLAFLSFLFSSLAFFPYFFYYAQFKSDIARIFGVIPLVILGLPLLVTVIAAVSNSTSKQKKSN